MTGPTMEIALSGLHRLTFPVADVARSVAWYHTRLGYRPQSRLLDSGQLTAARLTHPSGGPQLALRHDLARAAAAAGFDSFVFRLPDARAIEVLADHLAALGESHGGVHPIPDGWILPLVHDPDERELRFAAIETDRSRLPHDPPQDTDLHFCRTLTGSGITGATPHLVTSQAEGSGLQ